MHQLLDDAGRAALKAFLASLLIIAPGIYQAPDLNSAVALGIAALMAAIAAALAAIQVFVPKLSFRAYVPGLAGAALDSFAHAFLGAFLTSIVGWLQMPDLSTWRSVVVGAMVGALAAGLRAAQGLLTPGEHPSPSSGVREHRARRAGTGTVRIPEMLPA